MADAGGRDRYYNREYGGPPRPRVAAATPVELAFSPVNYLRELVELAARHLRLDGAPTGPGPVALARWLHQPVDRLVEPTADGSTNVAQARIAVEVLRVILPEAPATVEQQYRARAYAVILRELGTSPEELGRARTGRSKLRREIAARLGISADGRLDALIRSPRTITDAELQQLFGYPSTQDPQVPVAPAQLAVWRQEALLGEWARADAEHRDGTDPRPVIDPDVIGAGHLRGPGPALALWTARHRWIEDQLAAALERLSRADTPTRFDRATPDCGLTVAEQAFLAQVRDAITAGPIADDIRAEVASVLVQAAKRQVFASWRAQERAAGIVLDPATFVALVTDDPIAFPGPLRWRANWATLSDWRRTLLARELQATAARTACRMATVTAENEVLPALRDALLATLAGPDRTAQRLSQALSIDLGTAPGLRTTRVDQAITSMRALLISARSGHVDPIGRTAAIDDPTSFDRAWPWVQTYPRWCAAMAAFGDPRTRLRRTLFPAGRGRDRAPTAAFTAFIFGSGVDGTGLIDRVWLTPDDAVALAEAYLAAVQSEIADTPTLLRVLSRRGPGSPQVAYRQLCSALASATTVRPMPQYLREILSLVPTALGRKLQDSGQYLPALDWYRSALPLDQPAVAPVGNPSRPDGSGLVGCRINGVGPIGRCAA